MRDAATRAREESGAPQRRVPSWATLRRIWRREGKRAFLRTVLRGLCPDGYAGWTARHDASLAQVSEQRAQAAAWSSKPTFTVILALHDPASPVADASIASVVAQTYPYWDLRLSTDDARPAPAEALINRWATRDPRVGGQGPWGTFVMVLDAGDELAPDALFETAATVNRHADADLVYWDEDELSPTGPRCRPFFKPDWSPELLLSTDYLSPAVIRRDVMESVGIRPERAGLLPPWELVYRCCERARGIYHVPKILLHRRRGDGDRFGSGPVPDPPLDAIAEHCRRAGIEGARAEHAEAGLRVTWPPSGRRVSIIIPNKNSAPLLRRCVDRILNHTAYGEFEVLIMDTGSTDAEVRDLYARLAGDRRVRVLSWSGAFNYSAVNNAGAAAAQGAHLLFLNNDTEPLDADWLDELVRWADRPEIGAVGPKLLYPDDTIQHAGVIIGLGGLCDHIFRSAPDGQTGCFGSVDWYRNYLAVTGACMMMRRDVFEGIGGFDEQYVVAFSDIEICLRIVQRGYRVVYTPFARLRHYEGATRGQLTPAPDIRRALQHLERYVVPGDPYFNRNLAWDEAIPALPGLAGRSREQLLARLVARAGNG